MTMLRFWIVAVCFSGMAPLIAYAQETQPVMPNKVLATRIKPASSGGQFIDLEPNVADASQQRPMRHLESP
jgi:hypothetical protein